MDYKGKADQENQTSASADELAGCLWLCVSRTIVFQPKADKDVERLHWVLG